MTGEIAQKGDKAPTQPGQRYHVERTNAWHNALNRHQRGCVNLIWPHLLLCFDLADISILDVQVVRAAVVDGARFQA